MIASLNSNVTGVAYEPGMRQDLVYIGEDNRIYLLDFDKSLQGNQWRQYDLIALVQQQTRVTPPFPIAGGGTPRSGCPLATWSSVNESEANMLAYLGNVNNQIVVQAITLESPATLNLSQLSGTQSHPPLAYSRLAAYAWVRGNSNHVIYVDNQNHVRELYENGGGPWATTDLSANSGYTGINGPRAGSPLAGFAFENQGTQHVFYIAEDNTIRELYYTNRWIGNNLSQSTGAPPPAGYTGLGAYACEFENTMHVVYITATSDVQEIYWSNGWTAGRPDLTQTTSAPRPGPLSAIAGYPAEYERTQHVIYVDDANHIIEIYRSGNAWNYTDLTDSAGSGATAPRAQTPLAGYAFENERTHHVVYVDVNNNVHELYRSGNAWNSGIVSNSLGVMTAPRTMSA